MGYKLKRATIWRERQGRQPWANTIAYFPLKTDAVDVANNITLTSSGTTNYTTVWWVQSAEFTKSNWLYNDNVATVPQWGVAKTWNFWMYIKWSSTNRGWVAQMWWWSAAWDVFWIWCYTWTSNLVMTRNYSTSSTYTPTLNTWSNVAVTYYNSSWKMYVNGTLQVTWSETAPTNWNKLYLWQNVWSSSTNNTYYWNLSRVIIENKEWTAQDVLNYFNETKWDYGYTPWETMKELQLRPSMA